MTDTTATAAATAVLPALSLLLPGQCASSPLPYVKRVVLVSFSTLFSDLSDVMVGFFDSIVRASYWQQPTS